MRTVTVAILALAALQMVIGALFTLSAICGAPRVGQGSIVTVPVFPPDDGSAPVTSPTVTPPRETVARAPCRLDDWFVLFGVSVFTGGVLGLLAISIGSRWPMLARVAFVAVAVFGLPLVMLLYLGVALYLIPLLLAILGVFALPPRRDQMPAQRL